AMVGVLARGATPPAAAGLLAAGALVVTRVLSMESAYRGIAWTTVILVAGMIPLSTAMTQTGAAARLADGLVRIVGDSGSYALLLGLFVLTAVLGQLISNMATALIVIPIALSAARDLDVSARPVIMCVTVSAAAALLTPVATPANLMVMEPGSYRFTDYWKLGLPVLVLYGIVAVLLVPVFWRFLRCVQATRPDLASARGCGVLACAGSRRRAINRARGGERTSSSSWRRRSRSAWRSRRTRRPRPSRCPAGSPACAPFSRTSSGCGRS